MVRVISVLCFLLTAPAALAQSLYDEIGGAPKVNEIVENFVVEIQNDPTILEYFKGSDIERFTAKFAEQICMFAGGPCSYSGDTMEQVHGGMNINEADFNRTVDLLINAMNKAGVPHTSQNKLLATMVHTRKDMLYR